MQKLSLGTTGVEVSALCLGTMYFGSSVAKETSRTLLDMYLEAGGMFLDTANAYARWIQGCKGGESEALLGRWMKDRRNRESLFLASKVGFPVTLDAMVTPLQPGMLEVAVAIEYTDDFNKVRTITKTLKVDVLDASQMEPGKGGEIGEPIPISLPPETLMQVIWRFIRGFIGLDSARSDTGIPSFEGMPSEGAPPGAIPTAIPQRAVPVPGGKG